VHNRATFPVPDTALVEPPLTSVAPPAARLGREVMQMLKTLIEGRQSDHLHIQVPVELVIRQSCGHHENNLKSSAENSPAGKIWFK
jgi:DNA-binding LacI/PurR family transcriptional regulator